MSRVHLIGIGGSGLSAIARVLLESGRTVSGSDRQLSPVAQRLSEDGVQVFIGHRPENVLGVDLVVRSSAVPDDNVEVIAALDDGIPVLKRADYLDQLMADRQGIAVAGTHGKTTTTAMIAWVLTALGSDPSFIIGGISTNFGTNAHSGKGPHFVIEADEYDRMFLGLRPRIAVVTNVEHDHPDCYPTSEEFFQAFVDFVSRLEKDGLLVICEDDPGAALLLAKAKALGRRVRSYGIGNDRCDYWAQNLAINESDGFSFDVFRQDGWKVTKVSLQQPGEHNVRNALAALVVADELGLSMDQAAKALVDFQGTGRRFELRGEEAGVTVIDDYAHHPTEIRATLAAARARYGSRRIWAVWQPHTYSRTRTLFDDYTTAFADADRLLVTEVFAAREMPPEDGFSASEITDAISVDAQFVAHLNQVRDFLLAHLQSGDVLLVLSAGDADQVSIQVLQELKNREPASIK